MGVGIGNVGNFYFFFVESTKRINSVMATEGKAAGA
jgi:hypothetical protein